MNTYAKYCPNVFVAKCEEKHEKGEIIIVETKYGKENECQVWNLVAERNGFYYYSITRADGYDCQKRAEDKANRLLESSRRAEERASDYFRKSEQATEGIPLGQPILVGHHSEKCHRAALAKSHSAMNHACEEFNKAESYEQRAEYWKKRANVINLSMPESIEYYAFKLEECKKIHQMYLEHPEKREHAYSLTYSKKDVNEAQKNYETALKLWGENA